MIRKDISIPISLNEKKFKKPKIPRIPQNEEETKNRIDVLVRKHQDGTLTPEKKRRTSRIVFIPR